MVFCGRDNIRGLSVAEEEVEKNSRGEFETTIFPEFYTQLTVSGKPYMHGRRFIC